MDDDSLLGCPRIENTRCKADLQIKGEMLREIGIAKIDYDKRADEVLYGMDIRQVTRPDHTDPGLRKFPVMNSSQFLDQ